MITASEALIASKKKQIDIIENSINSAIEAGKYEVNFLNNLSEENKAMLIKSGYKLTSKMTMIGNEVTISWEEPKEKVFAKKINKSVKKK